MRQTGISFLALTLLGVILLGPNLAAAADKPVLMVLRVDSDGVGDPQKDAVLKTTKAEVAKYEMYQLLETPPVDLLDEMVNFECLEMDAECLSKIGAKHKADVFLYTRWVGGNVTVLLVDVKGVKALKTHEGQTSAAKLSSYFTNTAIIKVFGPVPKKEELVWVTIDANVAQADVFIDEKKVGQTPVKQKMLPGTYTVSLRKPEILMAEERIKVTGKKPVNFTANLKPIPKKKKVVVIPPHQGDPKKKTKEEKKDDDKGTPFYATWWFWSIVGVGVAAAVTGTALALSGSDSTETGAIRFSVDSGSAEKDSVFYNGFGAGGN